MAVQNNIKKVQLADAQYKDATPVFQPTPPPPKKKKESQFPGKRKQTLEHINLHYKT